MNERAEECCWLALRRVPGMGWKKLRIGLKEHGSPEILWKHLAQSMSESDRWWRQANEELEYLQNNGIRLLTCEDADYPDNLKCLDDSPLFIYRQGQELSNINKAVAVVGSRKCSSYGEEVTKRLVSQLVDQGFVIVSGMAKGIDSVAHQTALNKGGQTVAVCGYGLDQAYPGQNRRLAAAIRDSGQLVSAFGIGVRAQPYTFAVRNSVIAGLSLGVVVTEAGLQSGSLLTAEWAKKYKRPVLSVPGSIFGQGSQGTHQLIKLGADLVVDAADIVDKLGQQLESAATNNTDTISDKVSNLMLSEEQSRMVEWLGEEALSIDLLARRYQLSTAKVSAILMNLELMGVVRQVGDEWIVV